MKNHSFWQNRRVLVTGGAGFLGSFVMEKLRERDCEEIFVPRSGEYNLVEMEAVKRLYQDAKLDIVIHLAAIVGGIGANLANPEECLTPREPKKNSILELKLRSKKVYRRQ